MFEEMEKKEVDYKLCIANDLQFNEKAEADAIQNYNNLLEEISESNFPSHVKEALNAHLYEIIGDEMNHQTVLQQLYTLVTGIKENKS